MIVLASSYSFGLNDVRRKTWRNNDWSLKKFRRIAMWQKCFRNIQEGFISSFALRGWDKWMHYCHSGKRSSKWKVFAVKPIYHVEACGKSWVLWQGQYFISAENDRKKYALFGLQIRDSVKRKKNYQRNSPFGFLWVLFGTIVLHTPCRNFLNSTLKSFLGDPRSFYEAL